MKKIPFLQTVNYGCGIYCLANIFNAPELLEHIEEGKGHTMDEIVQVMDAAFPNEGMYTRPTLYIPEFGDPWRDGRVMDLEGEADANHEELYYMQFATVKTPSGKMHLIGLLQESTSEDIIVVDPLKEYTTLFSKGSFEELFKIYNFYAIHLVCSVSVPNMCFKPETFKHLI